ncbi:MAG: hypothetical protein E6R03_00560 [Hyphomicrobiaceae bacterium]|nr:MAG: hypothetical protein E6R03_00560 [Hyphomicrobiaceae bacterium]
MRKEDLEQYLLQHGVPAASAKDLTRAEIDLLVSVLEEQAASGSSELEDKLWEADYRERPVDIDQFIEDPEYLGNSLKRGEVVYERWREIHREINDPSRNISEVIFTGAIGTGKTFNAVIALGYDVYKLSCLRQPQTFYGLAEGSKIVYGLYNVFKYKVGTTSFPVLKNFVTSSPYFQKHFTRDPNVETTLRFPHNIQIISGSSDLHAIGDNLHAALIDEANFMKEKAKKKDEGAHSQAMQLHQSIQRRQESRFRTPGRIYLVSSKKHESSYTTNYIRRSRGRPSVYIADLALWDTKPKSFYRGFGDKKFRVYVGTAVQESRILKENEVAPENAEIVYVPEKHRDAFEMDVEGSLRDIAGVETVATRPLIQNRERLMQCVDRSIPYAFTGPTLLVGVKSEETIEDFFKHAEVLDVRASRYIPKRNPGALRFAHIDLALTGDCAGISVGHVADIRRVKRARADGSSYEATAPVIEIDIMTRVKAPIGDEIDISKIRAFLVALRQYGYNLHTISYDGWQSADSIQILTKEVLRIFR